ncbi:hypothetical protein ACWD5F_15290 [Streptomyces sp. NPDC002499]
MFDHAETVSRRSLERIKALGGAVSVQNRMMFQGEAFIDRIESLVTVAGGKIVHAAGDYGPRPHIATAGQNARPTGRLLLRATGFLGQLPSPAPEFSFYW